MEQKYVYVVLEEWSVSEEQGSAMSNVFVNYYKAKDYFNEMLEVEIREGCVERWRELDDYCEEGDKNYFECWIDGEWSCNHYHIEIHQLPLVE